LRTEQLEYLKEISKVKSMNKASKNLCISVQALNASMKNLENELEFKIFDSTYKGTQLTEKGKELLDAWYIFNNTLEKLKDPLESQEILEGKIQIVCVPGVIELVMPNFIVEFQKSHPNGEIEPILMSYENILGELLNEKIEFALVIIPCVDGHNLCNIEERFEFISLKKMRLYCIVNDTQYLAKQKSISISNILKQEIISCKPLKENSISANDILHYFSPNKQITTIEHRSIFYKLLKERKVVAITGSLDGDCIETRGIVNVPISDENVYAEFGLIKLKGWQLGFQAKMISLMLKDFLKTT